jgi:uncharacterized protein
MNLAGKRIVITGASSGIGLELIHILIDKGCKILAAARGIDKIDVVHRNLYTKKCDISKQQEVDDLFAYAIDVMGGIDVFVANAGFAYYERITSPDWEHIKKIYDTNVISFFYSVVKMKQLNGEKPFNFLCTASSMGFLSLPGYALYGSTKAAIHSFSEAYRFELSQNQILQVVYPIATKTNFFHNAGDSPVPWPTQSAAHVAKCIVKGIEHDKTKIFPSKTFLLTKKLFPFTLKFYQKWENIKFQRYIHKRG